VDKPGEVQEATSVNLLLPRDDLCDAIRVLVNAICKYCPDRQKCATWTVYSPEEI